MVEIETGRSEKVLIKTMARAQPWGMGCRVAIPPLGRHTFKLIAKVCATPRRLVLTAATGAEGLVVTSITVAGIPVGYGDEQGTPLGVFMPPGLPCLGHLSIEPGQQIRVTVRSHVTETATYVSCAVIVDEIMAEVNPSSGSRERDRGPLPTDTDTDTDTGGPR